MSLATPLLLFVAMCGAGLLSVLDGAFRPPFPEQFELRDTQNVPIENLLFQMYPGYLCASSAAQSCDRDPVNFLFINLKPETAKAVANDVSTQLKTIDLLHTWGPHVWIAATMYFSINGKRYERQKQLKDYQVLRDPADGWHVRFAASPGCSWQGEGACYVVGAAHYDDVASGVCRFIPVDVGFRFSKARVLVEEAFASGKYGTTTMINYLNDVAPVQRLCHEAKDHESNEIAVVNMAETDEVSWPIRPLLIMAIPPGDGP